MAVTKSIVVMVIVEIIIMNFVEVKKKENLDIKTIINNENAAKNIKRFGLKDQNLIKFTAGTVG
jgi:hypothetical protein